MRRGNITRPLVERRQVSLASETLGDGFEVVAMGFATAIFSRAVKHAFMTGELAPNLDVIACGRRSTSTRLSSFAISPHRVVGFNPTTYGR